MSFLPEGYKEPTTQGNYTRLQDGQNTFRIMSSAIIGYEYWTKENKPVRSKDFPKETPNAKVDENGKIRIKHFWAFVVWNYDTNSLQIMQVTQANIRKGIKALVDNKKWGDPKEYDITITKSGEKLDTEYNVAPNPKEPLQEDVKKLFADAKINLEALYTNDDPFGNNKDADIIDPEDIPFN